MGGLAELHQVQALRLGLGELLRQVLHALWAGGGAGALQRRLGGVAGHLDAGHDADAAGEPHDAEAAAQARQTIHSTLHWGDSWTGAAYKMDGETLLCKDLDQANLAAAAWHEYGLEWAPDRLAVTFDGKTVLERDPRALAAPQSGETPFADNLFHFVLNLALGSMANDPPKDGAGYPIAHEIDYVRVWQDPEVTGNRLLIGGKAPAFAGFACDDPDATPLIPADATVGADGGLTLAGGPLAIGGFAPTTAFTLTAEVTVPEGATGTLLGFRSGAGVPLRRKRGAFRLPGGGEGLGLLQWLVAGGRRPNRGARAGPTPHPPDL